MDRVWLWIGLLVMCLSGWAFGQGPATQQAAGEQLRVYLMTIGPGEVMYERFGHNIIWIHDPVAGTDVAYNYGVFDFDQENFVWRFIQGRMQYWADAIDAETMERLYREAGHEIALSPGEWLVVDYMAQDRDVWVQELNLTARQKANLRDFLEWNIRPENRTYSYDYYRDNCSTRVRDALDRPEVLGGAIRAAMQDKPTATTYRWHTRRLAKVDPILYTALYEVLGQPVDRPISQWEECFLPVKLMEHLRQVTVRDEDGNERPLVAREFQIYHSRSIIEPAEPPHWAWAIYLVIGLVLGGAMAGLAWGRRAASRWALGVMILAWSLVAGVAGVITTWAWFTDHTAAHWNENWLLLNPLSLALLIAGTRAAISRGRRPGFAPSVAAMVLLLAVLGVLVQVLPGMDQVNGEMICLAVPLHVGVLVALRQRQVAAAA